MPPKIKITKEDIVKTAISLVREKGMDAINARAIAAALCCSTQPIFSNFSGFEQLCEAVIEIAHNKYLETIKEVVSLNKYPEVKLREKIL